MSSEPNDNDEDKGTAEAAQEEAVPTRRRRRALPDLPPETTGADTTRIYRVFAVVADDDSRVIDELIPPGTLLPLGDTAAKNDKDAIDALVPIENKAKHVAIADRYYTERSPEVETKVTRVWS